MAHFDKTYYLSVLCLLCVNYGLANEVFRDCTRHLYDRVVRFEYLYYEGYWMYPYNKLRNHGPSYMYNEKEFYNANDMNTNAYRAAIHKVHERTIYEASNALPFYIKECGGGWACLESRHKDWRFYYLAITTRSTEPDVEMQWSLNPQVSGTHMHKIKCTDCNNLMKCQLIHQTGLKKYYSTRQGYIKACANCGEESWFYWRLVAPIPSDQYRISAVSDCKRNASFAVTMYKGSSVQNTFKPYYSSVEDMAFEFKKAFEKAAELRSLTFSQQWTMSDDSIYNKESSVQMGLFNVPPGKKFSIRQLHGTYGPFLIKTAHYDIYQESC
eukprot:TRINITY_DN2629_c0_g1_i2.p1 TRINITY_DN2629_c0_g1~~TRINITY_DN2629_c0_g1_i2.p1  ORF type:complete len:326 (-),score=66.42 TRINITY_DN2629_c0_g1_i2:44-1021(-)